MSSHVEGKLMKIPIQGIKTRPVYRFQGQLKGVYLAKRVVIGNGVGDWGWDKEGGGLSIMEWV